MTSNTEIMDRGIRCLLEKLGVVEAEQFISAIIREKFDYTKWQRNTFEDVELDEFHTAAVAYSQTNPFEKRK